MPAGVTKLMGNPEVDWMQRTEPDPSIYNRVSYWPTGKMLGGSSSLNGMVYIRGGQHDYDGWAANGCTGWSWNDVLPYFLRSEIFRARHRQAMARAGH